MLVSGIFLAVCVLLPAHGEDLSPIMPGAADAVLGHNVLILQDGRPPQDIGRVVDVLVDTDGRPVAAVLDVGGFLGVGNRRVAVSWPALRFEPARDGFTITLTLPADRIRAAPDYKGPDKPVQAVGP